MQKTMKRLMNATAFALSLLALQGCVATAMVTTAAVSTKVATDPRTIGTQIDDETLEEKVAYNLNKDAQLQEEARLNVVSYSGNVLLIGQTPNESAKEVAQNIASGVEGVRSVYNEIRIGETIGVGQIATDSWITTTIKSKLLFNSGVKTTDVKVITENGEVFLMGNLTEAQADSAAESARTTSGVRKVVKVVNYLK